MKRQIIDDETIRELKTHYQGFTIKCNECGSEAVGVDSDMGYSAESGSWGSVFLHCACCRNEKSIYGDL